MRQSTVGESKSKRFNQDVQILYGIVLDGQEVDTVQLLDGFDDTEGH